MVHLTKQERFALVALGLIISIGISLHYSFKINPRLFNLVNAIENNSLISKIDPNHAGLQELITLPYVGEMTANRILQYRKEHGPFQRVEDVRYVKGIGPSRFEKIKPCITIQSSN